MDNQRSLGKLCTLDSQVPMNFFGQRFVVVWRYGVVSR